MLKNTLAVSLIVLYVLVIFRPWAPLMYYAFEQTRHTQSRCIDLFKPERLCSGKVLQEIKLKELQQDNYAFSIDIKTLTYPLSVSPPILLFVECDNLSIDCITDSPEWMDQTESGRLFHPPRPIIA